MVPMADIGTRTARNGRCNIGSRDMAAPRREGRGATARKRTTQLRASVRQITTIYDCSILQADVLQDEIEFTDSA